MDGWMDALALETKVAMPTLGKLKALVSSMLGAGDGLPELTQ